MEIPEAVSKNIQQFGWIRRPSRHQQDIKLNHIHRATLFIYMRCLYDLI